MLRLPPFRFRVPGRLDEAARILADDLESTRVVAGGTDLWPNMKRRHQQASTVVSLMDVPELRGIEADGKDLRLGATTTLDRVARHREVESRYPALARAVRSISSPPLRNMGTLGGNLCLDTRCTYYNQTEEWRRSIDYCLKESGSICWVAPGSRKCLAHTASDSAPILCALDGRVRLVSAKAERSLPLAELFRDDGIDYLAKGRDEILTDVMLPAASARGRCRSAFWKLRRRGTIDFAVLSVAVTVWPARGIVEAAHVYLGAVSSRPLRADRASEFLVGKPLTEEVIEEAARLARKPATPFDNTDFQAQWRAAMVGRYTAAALREVAGLDPGLLPPRHAWG